MSEHVNQVIVTDMPNCDMPHCKRQARYDAKTKMGPWAYMCNQHFESYGLKLGVGFGQELIARRPQAPQES